jgi:hypothetical protein
MARSYQKSGLHALKRRLQVRGLASLDKRSATFRQAMDWRRAVETDLGVTLTAAKTTILNNATLRVVLLDHAARWLIEQIEKHGPLAVVNARRRQLYPLVGQITALTDSLDRAMAQLGLERPVAARESEHDLIRAVRGDLRRARRPKKPRNGIPSSPQEPTSTTEPIQDSAAAPIAQEAPTTPTTPST